MMSDLLNLSKLWPGRGKGKAPGRKDSWVPFVVFELSNVIHPVSTLRETETGFPPQDAVEDEWGALKELSGVYWGVQMTTLSPV